MRTVLVSGGCGFIGSHFIKLLLSRDSWRVVNLDKLTYAGDLARLARIGEDERYRFVHGDIGDRELVHELFGHERPWAVVNFAAESHVDRSILDPGPFLRTNVVGTQVLMDAARISSIERFLQVSTDEVYGDAEGEEPFSEESPLRPSSPYSASKAAADLLCLAEYRTYDLPVLIARSSNNYGPYQFPEKLIPLIIRNALTDQMLPVYGDGGQRRDWLFVEDNCEALLTILERGQAGAIYNVAAGEERANLDVVRALCHLLAEQTGSDPNRFFARIQSVSDRPGHDRRYALNTRRIETELSWRATVDLHTGLNRTVSWYLSNLEWVERITSGEYTSYYEAVYTRTWGRGR